MKALASIGAIAALGVDWGSQSSYVNRPREKPANPKKKAKRKAQRRARRLNRLK